MKDKRNCHDAVGKCLRNNIFINLLPLPLSCEISGALHLVQLGLMAIRQTKYMQVNFENFRIRYRSTFCFVS